MSLRSESEEQQVEYRGLTGEMTLQRRFIISSGRLGTRDVRRHWMDIRRWTRNMIKERFLRHQKVTVCIVRRNIPLVSPEHVHIRPWDLFSKPRRQQTVERSRRAPARQHH